MSWLDHQRSKHHLDSYVDAELPETLRERIERHVDECPDSAAHVRLLLAVRRSLRRLNNPAAPTLRRLEAGLTGLDQPGAGDIEPTV